MKDGGDLSDSEIIERAKSDPEAFGLLYERFVDRIFNYVYYRVGDKEDAEDLTARTFQRALNNVKNFENRGAPVSAWLYRIAHNLVANWHRDRSRRKVIPLESIATQRADTEAPVVAAQREEWRQVLLRTIRKLPPERQLLLHLKFNEHLSNAEIGEVMGRSESAIKSLYHRTLVALREDMTRMGFTRDDWD